LSKKVEPTVELQATAKIALNVVLMAFLAAHVCGLKNFTLSSSVAVSILANTSPSRPPKKKGRRKLTIGVNTHKFVLVPVVHSSNVLCLVSFPKQLLWQE
jgi:hypothetical protein